MSKYGEPWVQEQNITGACTEIMSASQGKALGGFWKEAHANRAKRCVNACSGLSMQGIPEGAVLRLVRAARAVQNSHPNDFLKIA